MFVSQVFGAEDALAVADSLNMRSLVSHCTSSATDKVCTTSVFSFPLMNSFSNF